jgi:hypothetical protein
MDGSMTDYPTDHAPGTRVRNEEPGRYGRWYTLVACHDPQHDPQHWCSIHIYYDDPQTPGAEPQETLRFESVAAARSFAHLNRIAFAQTDIDPSH